MYADPIPHPSGTHVHPYTPTANTADELAAMPAAELRRRAELAGIPTAGTKAALIAALTSTP